MANDIREAAKRAYGVPYCDTCGLFRSKIAEACKRRA